MDLVEARWHNPQQAQIATDGLLKLDTRKYKSVRELTIAVERLIVVPGVEYNPQVLLTMFLRCLPTDIRNLLASEARREYHTFESFSKKALDLEVTLGGAQTPSTDGRKKKTPQEWKKKGSRFMMVDYDGNQTEIDDVFDLVEGSEFDGEESAEGSNLAAVVKTKAAGRGKGSQQRSQGQAANPNKIAAWVRAGLDQEVWRDRSSRGACINCVCTFSYPGGEINHKISFLVSDELPFDMLLGMYYLEVAKPQFDWDKKVLKHELPSGRTVRLAKYKASRSGNTGSYQEVKLMRWHWEHLRIRGNTGSYQEVKQDPGIRTVGTPLDTWEHSILSGGETDEMALRARCTDAGLSGPLKVLKNNMLSLHAHVDSRLDFMHSTLDQILDALTKQGFRSPAQSSLPLTAMSGPFPVQVGTQPSGTSAAVSQTVASSSSGPAVIATSPQQPVQQSGQPQGQWYPKTPMKPPLAFSGERKDEEFNTGLRMVPIWVKAKRTLPEDEVVTAASYLEGKAAKWLDGVVVKVGYGRCMADWAKSLTLDQFMEMVEARWHNPQEAQRATDAINKLDQRKFRSVRELTTTVESLILVPGINYSDQFLLTTFVRCLPENIRNLLASEAGTEYHSFETLSRKALDLEATLGNAQPTSGNDSKKKKSPQEWKKKGAKLMMVESDGTQTEIDKLSDLMDYSEYDDEEVVEGGTLAAVVKTKAGGRGKGQPRSQGKTASNQTKQAEWFKAGLDQDVWRDRRMRGACINCGEYGHTQWKCQNAKVTQKIAPQMGASYSQASSSGNASFLGMCGYYRNFVKNYSTVASPLTDLTRLDTPWDWSDECTGAFKRLKHALMNHEVLMVPDPQKPFIVTTDASQYGIGAVLAQQDGKKLRPIDYMSKKMPSKKLAKSTYERELYALYKALVHWRHFLLGRFFYLRTDHQTLKWIKTQPTLSYALKRWIEVIDQYDFKLEYLKGEYNKVVDALSRRADYLGALVSEFGVSNEVTQSLVGAYQEDPVTMDIIRKLQAKDKATESEFVMVDGLIYLDKAGDQDRDQGGGGFWREKGSEDGGWDRDRCARSG
ncbi:hypothetical protein CBR_g52127 [Chara braunii]|uniref:CCHC-type domain-containing protein n=1 Tax=Chara braunii TaxID=69332 RepID=A0A388M9I6_CHABU|nr:hypothetical protein CBR_g52127 [Chara braunii]|eukprot:GBG91241.1 hypothetical protein CBR_g52127 [Chara braunii]